MVRHSFLTYLAGFLLLIAAPQSLWADATNTITAEGLFSFQVPDGWKITTSPASKYPLAMDKPHNNFSANINVVIEPYAGSLANYVAANKSLMTNGKVFVTFDIVEEKPFVTTSGANGVRLVANDTLGQLKMRQTFYFFEGSAGNKFVVTASSLTDDKDHFAPIFDSSVKTFSPH